MNYVGRTRRGDRVTSGPVGDGQYGWSCDCGSFAITGTDDQDATLAARNHAMRCGRPKRPATR
ncbi:hypothetical protein [Streptomyces sp. NBC_01361]|uniref:hypothetical protein n=1 Tax=Streptomyces sp. NBC_01361 TaxID=2903838 RepID=UPI002E3353F3|nr:hypothetical protein [Streptomyces sp. NBC_01361]